MDSLTKDITSRNRIVSEIDKNFFVEAGAGSGKTTMLVNRMVAMVEKGIDIKKICAITFTKAAANEFYERFQKLLIERSNPGYKWEDKGYAGQLPEPNDKTRNLCAKALKDIDLCFMGTIDSFCNMVLSEHPTEAGILSDSILVSDDELKAFLNQMYVKICNGQYGDELVHKANMFRIVTRDEKEVFYRGMKMLLEHRNVHFNYSEVKDFDIDETYADFRQDMIKLSKCLKDHPEIRYVTSTSSNAWNSISDIYYALTRRWSTNFPSVLWALRTLNDITIVTSAMDEYGLFLNGYFEEASSRKKRLKCTVNEKDGFAKITLNSQYDVSMDFMVSCLPYVVDAMHELGYLTYFDYLYYLREMLKKDVSKESGKLIRHIYNRHSYFLIDEFQDTNPMQAEVFFYLSADNPAENWQDCTPRPGSLFIVGDPKQSIYRFRNADVTSFLNVKKLFVEKGGELLELSRNFRSEKDLCEYYNKRFSELLPEETINQSKFEEIPASDERQDEFKGVFSYNPVDKELDPKVLSIMISILIDNEKYLIRGKDGKELRKIKYNDIMIITYSKRSITAITDRFNQDGIPAKVEGEVKFSDNEALNEIFRIYSLVADPDDKIALYGALNGSIIDITNGELVKYRSLGGEVSLNGSFDASRFDDESAKNVAERIEELKAFAKDSQNMSPAALLSNIMDHYKIYDHVNAENLEVVFYTLELLRNEEKNGKVVTLKDGKEYLNKLLTGGSDIERCLSLNDEEDRVHIANLHKVKGLEAPVIILPAAQIGGGGPSIRIEYQKDTTEGYLFALTKDNPEDGYFFATSGADEEREKEKDALKAEDTRKIYVAATRARNALIISNFAAGKNRWASLKPELLPDIYGPMNPTESSWPEIGKLFDAEDLYEEAEKKSILNNRKAEDASYSLENPSRLGIVSKSSKDKDIPGSEDEAKAHKSLYASIMGTMVHKLMEMIVHAHGNADIAKLVDEIVNEYKSARLIPYLDKITCDLSSVAETMSNGGYNQDNGLPADILSVLLTAQEVYCEVPFCYKEETEKGVTIWNGVMDVVYCSGGNWHIVDYKTNAEGDDLDTKYQNQLAAYVKAFKETTGNDADAMTYHIDV